jgi:hypothetical protein
MSCEFIHVSGIKEGRQCKTKAVNGKFCARHTACEHWKIEFRCTICYCSHRLAYDDCEMCRHHRGIRKSRITAYDKEQQRRRTQEILRQRRTEAANAHAANQIPARAPPAQVIPARAPPAQVIPARAPPAQVIPARAPPAQVIPARTPPAQVIPARAPPAQVIPARAPPAQVIPARAPPAQVIPARTPPAQVIPARAPPAQVIPARAPPAQVIPARAPPAQVIPARAPPAQVIPARTPPANAQVATHQIMTTYSRSFDIHENISVVSSGSRVTIPTNILRLLLYVGVGIAAIDAGICRR